MQPRRGREGRGAFSNDPSFSHSIRSSGGSGSLAAFSNISGDAGYFGESNLGWDLPPLSSSSTSSSYLPPLQDLTLDPLPPGARRRSTQSGFQPSLRRRSSFSSRLPGLGSPSSLQALPPLQPSFISSTHATSFHLPPLPPLLPVSARTAGTARRRNNVNCICGECAFHQSARG